MSESSSYPQRRHPRLVGYDYHTPGYYFVTICTQHRQPLFGSIAFGEMSLSSSGQMVQAAWQDIVALHSGVSIDTSVTLPDHVHAIAILEDNPRRTLSLSDVMHRYKSQTTKRCAHGVRDHGWPRYDGKLWQEGFYDHVIRGDEALDGVRRYMVENAQRLELRRTGEPAEDRA